MKSFISFLNEIYKFGSQNVHKRDENRWGFELELLYDYRYFDNEIKFLKYLEENSKLDLEYSDDPSIKDYDSKKYAPIEIKTLKNGVPENELQKINKLSETIKYLYRKKLVSMNKSCGLHFHINLTYEPNLFDQLAALIELDENKFYNLFPSRFGNIYAINKDQILDEIIKIWYENKENYHYKDILREKFFNIALLYPYQKHGTAEFRLLPATAILNSENIYDYVKYILGLIDHVRGRQVVKYNYYKQDILFYRKGNSFIISEKPLKNINVYKREKLPIVFDDNSLIDALDDLYNKLQKEQITTNEIYNYLYEIYNSYIYDKFYTNIFCKFLNKNKLLFYQSELFRPILYYDIIDNEKIIKYLNKNKISIMKLRSDFIKYIYDKYQIEENNYIIYYLFDIILSDLKLKNKINKFQYLKFKKLLKILIQI